jgi:hypothetical protein
VDYWRASDQFLTASHNAARRFAFHEAETLAARGLRCLIHVARNPDAARRETDLAFARFVALAAVEGYGSSQVEEVMRRLITLAGELGDTATTAAALSARWAVHMARGECAAAKAIGQRFEAVARSSDNAVLLIDAQMQSQIACHHLGELDEADRYMTAIVAAAPNVPVADRLISIYDPVVGSLGESSRNAWITGRFTRAEAHSAEALALAREFGHPDSIAFASIFVAIVASGTARARPRRRPSPSPYRRARCRRSRGIAPSEAGRLLTRVTSRRASPKCRRRSPPAAESPAGSPCRSSAR